MYRAFHYFFLRRERRAERLRRSYEALGREQNSIFESLAEYTHEVQAEVRGLQIARDRLYAAQQASSEPPAGILLLRVRIIFNRCVLEYIIGFVPALLVDFTPTVHINIVFVPHFNVWWGFLGHSAQRISESLFSNNA